MKKIILASTSPRRKKLLSQIGLSFTVVPSHYEEKLNPRLKAKGQAEFLSKEKAKAVAIKYTDQDVVIISADQVIQFKDETLGKPKSVEDARRVLRRMSGTSHLVVTAFTIIDTGKKTTSTKTVETKVFMKKLSAREIDTYVASGEPMGRAGAYAIEERGGAFVQKIEGDFYNVVGLPLCVLTEELKKYGVVIF